MQSHDPEPQATDIQDLTDMAHSKWHNSEPAVIQDATNSELGNASSKTGSDLRNDLNEAMTDWAAHKYKLHRPAPQIVMEDSAIIYSENQRNAW